MIVCHCEAVNDRTVRAAIACGAHDVETLGARCHAGTDCGGCHRSLERLLDEVQSTLVSTATAAVA